MSNTCVHQIDKRCWTQEQNRNPLMFFVFECTRKYFQKHVTCVAKMDYTLEFNSLSPRFAKKPKVAV